MLLFRMRIAHSLIALLLFISSQLQALAPQSSLVDKPNPWLTIGFWEPLWSQLDKLREGILDTLLLAHGYINESA